jgi:large repetitive protein
MKSWTMLKAAAVLAIPLAVLSSCDRTDPTAPAMSTITMSANPTQLGLRTGSGTSTITAVVEDADGSPVSGVRVRFSVEGGGTLEHGPDGATTNSNGVATDKLTMHAGDPDATVTGRAAGAGSDSVTVTAGDNAPPIANPVVTPIQARTGQTVNFDGTSSSDSDGTIASYLWTITPPGGTAFTKTDSNFDSTFNTAGTVTVKLKVTDDLGKTGEKTVSPALTIMVNFPPTAVLTTSTPTVQENSAASFSGLTSSDSDGTVVAWDWNFGDGSTNQRTLTGTTTHTYLTATGSPFTVRLTVYDNGTASCTSPSTTYGDPPCTGSLPSTEKTVQVSVTP